MIIWQLRIFQNSHGKIQITKSLAREKVICKRNRIFKWTANCYKTRRNKLFVLLDITRHEEYEKLSKEKVKDSIPQINEEKLEVKKSNFHFFYL